MLDDDPAIPRLLSDYRHIQLPEAPQLQRRIEQEFVATDAAAGLALQSAILELIAQACRDAEPARERKPAWLIRVDERLHDDPCTVPTLAGLATLGGVHPAHLARTFQRVHGMSVGEYLRRLRVEHARAALARTRQSIATIAADAGFASQSHFTRVFHRITGETPLAWRHRMQNGG